jgi:alpha-1,3-rhamnosyl/mannosyltransferase
MRIGVDARQLCGQPTGVGNYLACLIREWAMADGHGHQFFLYAPEAVSIALDSRRFLTRVVAGSAGTWWEQVRVPRSLGSDRLDVFFAPDNTAPIALRLPLVVTIHDVSFAAHPEWFRTREGLRLRWLSRRAALTARAVITVSEFSRQELIDHFGVAGARLHVIPSGVPPRRAVASGPRPPRLLFVGSIFNRRHVIDLIRAFAPIARRVPNASLDLAGDNRSFPRQDVEGVIANERLEGRIRWHRYASDEQLRELYSRATAFAFLSEYEGLGMTPLEALTAGLPPVVVDTPVAREAYGDAALYVQLGALPPITRALEAALFDEAARAQVLAAAPAVLAKYSWPRAARETLRVIEAAAGPPTHG